MIILFLDINNKSFLNQSAKLLSINFACWSDIHDAEMEITECCSDENIMLIALENEKVIGLIGANPQYERNVWEMHPLVVSKEARLSGVGKRLVTALESEVSKKGGITMYLGTDDENNSTSLSNIDIYDNVCDKMKNVKNINNHPFEFYQKCGYIVVGVVPDANGFGKPDIMMAKRIQRTV